MNTKEFEALTPEQKRVAVARDVIEQVMAERYVATPGTYVDTNRYVRLSQPVLNRKWFFPVKCEVCAYGAAALSIIRLDNKFKSTLRGSLLVDERTALCERIFSEEQMYLIEACFEGHGYGLVGRDFHARFPNSQDRIIAIFQNIVNNNGTFKP